MYCDIEFVVIMTSEHGECGMDETEFRVRDVRGED